MNRAAAVGALLTIALVAGCSGVRGAGPIKGAVSASMITGIVSNVQVLPSASAAGALVSTTTVVLQEPLGFNTLVFCGNLAGEFPLGKTIQVSFNPSQPCSTVTSVQVV